MYLEAYRKAKSLADERERTRVLKRVEKEEWEKTMEFTSFGADSSDVNEPRER